MAKNYYNKLIRDNIPAIMDAKGAAYETRILEDAEFLSEILRKAGEEGAELAQAKSRTEVIAEMGDLLDVVDAIRAEYGIVDEELMASRAAQWKKKGGFARRIYLLWSEDK